MEADRKNLLHAMEQSDFYLHPFDAVQRRETHISVVFLTGAFAYKIKKPVRLDFLDFSTLQKREEDCRREIFLNRRMSGDIYLEVVPITYEGDQYRLGGAGTVVEFAVKMRQLPDDFSMVRLLQERKIAADELRDLGSILTEFYHSSRTGSEIDEAGSWAAVCRNCNENFQQLAPFEDEYIDARRLTVIRTATRAFLNRRKSLFVRRVSSGRIRDCHGDLRAEHIYFTGNGIQIIDCIEFNDRFRYGDTASDLGFLAMDLDFLGFPDTAAAFLSEYVEQSRDDELFTLIDFYKCYRAMVRAKVNCILLDEGVEDKQEEERIFDKTRRYLELAYWYAVQFTRPKLWVVCGMIASGKSAVADRLAEKFNIRVLRSDLVRKQLLGIEAEEKMDAPFNSGIYSNHATSLTYGRLLSLAQQNLERGASVIIDATFSSMHWRKEAMRLAEDMDANLLFIECTASECTLRKRLKDREQNPSVSDARLKHFRKFKNRFESLAEIPEGLHIRIDTDQPLEDAVSKVLASGYEALSEEPQIIIEGYKNKHNAQ